MRETVRRVYQKSVASSGWRYRVQLTCSWVSGWERGRGAGRQRGRMEAKGSRPPAGNTEGSGGHSSSRDFFVR